MRVSGNQWIHYETRTYWRDYGKAIMPRGVNGSLREMMNKILAIDFERIDKGFHSKKKLSGSTIIITGCAGFLGFYLIQYLISRREILNIEKIIGLDSFLLGKPKWLNDLLLKNINFLEIISFDVSKDKFSKFKEVSDSIYLIHAASIASPSFYRQYPLQTVDANIWGLRDILDTFSVGGSIKGLLFFSS
jgi:UDP-glucuronate decarboxylase